MGIEPFLVGSAVDCVLGPAARPPAVLEVQGAVRAHRRSSWSRSATPYPRRARAHLLPPVGCSDCAKTGYKGRLALHEVMAVTDDDRAAHRRARVRDQDHAGRDRGGHAHAARGRPAQGRAWASPRSTRSSASSPERGAEPPPARTAYDDRAAGLKQTRSRRPMPRARTPETTRALRTRSRSWRPRRTPECPRPAAYPAPTGYPAPEYAAPEYPAPAYPAPTSDTAVPDYAPPAPVEASAPTTYPGSHSAPRRPRLPPTTAPAGYPAGACARSHARRVPPRARARARGRERARPRRAGVPRRLRGAVVSHGRASTEQSEREDDFSLVDALTIDARAGRLRPAPDDRCHADDPHLGIACRARRLPGAHAAGDPARHVRDHHPGASARSSRRASSSTSPTPLPGRPASA